MLFLLLFLAEGDFNILYDQRALRPNVTSKENRVKLKPTTEAPWYNVIINGQSCPSLRCVKLTGYQTF